jgi:hypothetical protein
MTFGPFTVAPSAGDVIVIDGAAPAPQAASASAKQNSTAAKKGDFVYRARITRPPLSLSQLDLVDAPYAPSVAAIGWIKHTTNARQSEWRHLANSDPIVIHIRATCRLRASIIKVEPALSSVPSVANNRWAQSF